ncbi:carboxymuconolactone decarboxylase family protein [Devosia sp. A369]
MAHISQLAYADATPEQQQAHDEELRLRGRMTNMKRTLYHSPAALRIYGEWFTLRDELLPVLGDRPIWVFAHAICVASGSAVGTGFMRRALIQGGDNPDSLDLSEAETLLQRFGAAIGADPKSVPDELWAALAARYSDKTLVDLVGFAGLMVATNLFTDAVATDLDVELLPFLAG